MDSKSLFYWNILLRERFHNVECLLYRNGESYRYHFIICYDTYNSISWKYTNSLKVRVQFRLFYHKVKRLCTGWGYCSLQNNNGLVECLNIITQWNGYLPVVKVCGWLIILTNVLSWKNSRESQWAFKKLSNVSCLNLYIEIFLTSRIFSLTLIYALVSIKWDFDF